VIAPTNVAALKRASAEYPIVCVSAPEGANASRRNSVAITSAVAAAVGSAHARTRGHAFGSRASAARSAPMASASMRVGNST